MVGILQISVFHYKTDFSVMVEFW